MKRRGFLGTLLALFALPPLVNKGCLVGGCRLVGEWELADEPQVACSIHCFKVEDSEAMPPGMCELTVVYADGTVEKKMAEFTIGQARELNKRIGKH